MLCLACHRVPAAPAPLPPPKPVDRGTAGASARREAERRASRSSGSRSWEKGAVGEEWLESELDRRVGTIAVLLHDRKIPRSSANIDHLAIAPSGIWIIDAKNYSGRVERRDCGSFTRVDDRLYVNGRNQTKLVSDMGRQVDAVRKALEPIGFAGAPIHPALCFVGGGLPLFGWRRFMIDGVLVGEVGAISKRIEKGDALLSPDAIQTVANELSARLRASASALA